MPNPPRDGCWSFLETAPSVQTTLTNCANKHVERLSRVTGADATPLVLFLLSATAKNYTVFDGDLPAATVHPGIGDDLVVML